MKRIDRKYLFLFSYIAIFCVALLRVGLDHPYNFVPIFAALLFFAANRPAREFVFPLLALIGVDIFLTTHQYGYSLTMGAAVTWIWYLAVLVLGSGLLRNAPGWRRVAATSLLASVSFFLVSNVTVWAEWNMYPHTLGGLGACYLSALPFFRNSLCSELFCSLLLFGLASSLNLQQDATAESTPTNSPLLSR